MISMDEMRRTCGVSDRTIYRYLNILGRLEVLGEESDEIHMARTSGGRHQSLRATDLEILSFALTNNPLLRFRYMKRRLHAIKAVLENCFGSPPRGGCITLADQSENPEPIGGEAADAALEAFLQARIAASRVRLRMKGRRGRGRIYYPRGLRVAGDNLKLLVVEAGLSKVVAIDLETVALVEIVS